jgi:DNA-binding transcriptional MerR regulator
LNEKTLPPIPAKRYFTIGEVSELCAVKPYVLRYWEQEFAQLKPMKRRGNRRYYQRHEVLLVRRIRELLYEHGFTISGARNRLVETGARAPRGEDAVSDGEVGFGESSFDADGLDAAANGHGVDDGADTIDGSATRAPEVPAEPWTTAQVRQELLSIRGLLLV